MRRSKEIIHHVQFSSCASVIGCLSTVRKVLILLNAFRFRQMAHATRAVNKLCIRIHCRAGEVCYAPHPVP